MQVWQDGWWVVLAGVLKAAGGASIPKNASQPCHVTSIFLCRAVPLP